MDEGWLKSFEEVFRAFEVFLKKSKSQKAHRLLIKEAESLG